MTNKQHNAFCGAVPSQGQGTLTRWPIEPWLPLLLIVLTAVVYANGLFGPFVFDDINHIERNPRAQEFWTLEEYFTRNERPLLFFSLALNYQLGGLNPLGYKVFNVAVHIGAALALMGLVRRTLLLPRFGESFRDSAAGLGFAVAALWVVHPLATEAVTYVISRSESMMGMFALTMFYCVVRGAQSRVPWPWYVAATVAGTLGFGCKQWMIVVPLVLLLYDRIMLGGSWQVWALRRGPIYIAMLIPIGWMLYIHRHDLKKRLELDEIAATAAGHPHERLLVSTAAALPKSSSEVANADTNEFALGTPRRYSPREYLLTQPGVVAHYLRLAVWPYPLCVDYFWRKAVAPEQIFPPAIFLGTLMLATCWALWRYPPWGFLGAAFFLLLAPSSSIAPIEDMATERRMYLPLAALVALFVMAVWTVLGRLLVHSAQDEPAADRLAAEHRRRFAGTLLLVFGVAVLGSLTVLRNFDYTDEIDFWDRVIQVAPHNTRARVNIARGLIIKGDAAAATNPELRDACYAMALEHLYEGEKMSPKGPFVHSQIGHIRAQQAAVQRQAQRPGWEKRSAEFRAEAEKRFRRAVELQGDNPLFRLNLATVLEQKGTPAATAEALVHYQKAVDLGAEQRYAESHNGLARLLEAQGSFAEAAQQYAEVVRLRPDLIMAQVQMADALVNAGEWTKGMAAAEDALRRAQLTPGEEGTVVEIQKHIEDYRKKHKR